MYVWFDAGVERGDESKCLLEKLAAIGDRTIVTKHIIRSVYEGSDIAFANKLNAIYEKEKTIDIFFDKKGR